MTTKKDLCRHVLVSRRFAAARVEVRGEPDAVALDIAGIRPSQLEILHLKPAEALQLAQDLQFAGLHALECGVAPADLGGK